MEEIQILSLADIRDRLEKYEAEISRKIFIRDGAIAFNYGYEIDLDSCKTHEDILEWVHHLLGKKWITTELIERFIELAAGYHKLKIYRNGSGKKKVNPERAKMSQKLRYEILTRDGRQCVICGRTATDGIKLHVDHIKPIYSGGKTTPKNLRTLCSECNIGKSTSEIEADTLSS